MELCHHQLMVCTHPGVVFRWIHPGTRFQNAGSVWDKGPKHPNMQIPRDSFPSEPGLSLYRGDESRFLPVIPQEYTINREEEDMEHENLQDVTKHIEKKITENTNQRKEILCGPT